MPAELHYAADIGSLCRRREIADGHVLDHTATERAHLGHLGTSCPKGWAVDTLILADRRRPSRPLSFCRDSGFVQSGMDNLAHEKSHGLDRGGRSTIHDSCHAACLKTKFQTWRNCPMTGVV